MRINRALVIARPGTGLVNALLAGDPAHVDATAEVETHAGVVTVRYLTRADTLQIGERVAAAQRIGETVPVSELEQQMVALGMVDPTMTEAEVKAWQEHERAAGALGDVADRIAQISGIADRDAPGFFR